MSQKKIKDQEVKFKNEEKLQIKIEKEYKDAKTSYRSIKYEADRIDIKNQTFGAHMNSVGGLGNAMNSITNGLAGVFSADQRAEASTFKLNADKSEFQKSFEQNIMQTTLDQLQKSGQFIDKVLQAKSSMEQSQAGQLSSSIRA